MTIYLINKATNHLDCDYGWYTIEYDTVSYHLSREAAQSKIDSLVEQYVSSIPPIQEYEYDEGDIKWHNEWVANAKKGMYLFSEGYDSEILLPLYTIQEMEIEN